MKSMLIVTDPRIALECAYSIQGKWEPGEYVISLRPGYAYLYASRVLCGPFPEGEEAIATNAHYSVLYATFCLKGRFELGEAKINKNNHYREMYLDLLKDRNIKNPFTDTN